MASFSAHYADRFLEETVKSLDGTLLSLTAGVDMNPVSRKMCRF
jgi:hypothetical protein